MRITIVEVKFRQFGKVDVLYLDICAIVGTIAIQRDLGIALERTGEYRPGHTGHREVAVREQQPARDGLNGKVLLQESIIHAGRRIDKDFEVGVFSAFKLNNSINAKVRPLLEPVRRNALDYIRDLPMERHPPDKVCW